MAQYQDLLIEIGTEELPPTALLGLSTAFHELLLARLDEQRLAHGEARAFATPRRLALIVSDVAVQQPDQTSLRRGPALAAAFDASGAPTKAALGFARSCGVEVAALEREETAKGTWLVHRQHTAGTSTQTLLPVLIERALGDLPIPKRMRWGDRDEEFIRPVHWVCVLLGHETVPGQVLGIPIGNQSRGHRFHQPEPLTIVAPAVYLEALREARVEPDFAARRTRIVEQVEQLAATVGGRPALSDDLLDEVTALCEWPVAMLAGFDAAYLAVPPEVLIETMQKNQKYVALLDVDGHLLPRFIFISNIESRTPEAVRAGNERVIRPRFADAKFFWEQDLKTPLAERVEALAGLLFQQQLGSMREKAGRLAVLARAIALELGIDGDLAERAAMLAKCDLMTQMVGEFPSLQGIMGRYYAARAGEKPAVVAAMEEHYLPRQAGDRLPASPCGQAIALADRLDTLVGIFAIGQRPTGVKDPYGLRRAAIGVLRILIETPLPLDLRALLAAASDAYPSGLAPAAGVDAVFDYIMERLKGYYGERGIGQDVVAAVLAVDPTRPADIDRRIAAVQAFTALPEADALAAANKRIRNILRQAAEAEIAPTTAVTGIDSTALTEPAERALAQRVKALEHEIAPLLAAQQYTEVLSALAGLRGEVDAFFDAVMVMAEDAAVRRNRLAILQALQTLFLGVADIALLQRASEA
ncbi:MAG: glycine--tRNA ligase subunit beta [Chromatiaceae bacterium]|nr:MAG: glycine--tRNA ligase subunit beta [Chromatiaceae bacterium]